jgi:hypothetical protein
MVVHCEEVWREISNYLEGDVDPALRSAMEDHMHGCSRCRSVLDGTRNVIELYGDERMSEVPLGFSSRLRLRLEENMQSSRRNFFGWIVAAATAILFAGSFELARSTGSAYPALRSQMAKRGSGVPPEMLVVVSDRGKEFHQASCPFIHDKVNLRTIPAQEAMKEGYTPCVRCMKEYLST